jgi:hypothetical protein
VQFSAKPGSGGFGSLPNGSTGFIGLLDDCTNVDPTAQPCVTNRTGTYKQQIGNIEIDVSIPASFTGDPYRSH